MKSLSANRKWTLAAAAVWLAGVGAASSLVYALDRPLTIVPEPASFEPRHPSITEVSDPAASTASPVLELPTVVIAVHRERPPAPRSVAAPQPRDISEMKCSPWRDLQMGSGRVRVCE